MSNDKCKKCDFLLLLRVLMLNSGLDPSPKALFKSHFMHFYSSNTSLICLLICAYYWPHKCVSEKTHEEAKHKYKFVCVIWFDTLLI